MLKFAEEKGFYIILGLCVLAIGVSGYVLFFTGDPVPEQTQLQTMADRQTETVQDTVKKETKPDPVPKAEAEKPVDKEPQPTAPAVPQPGSMTEQTPSAVQQPDPVQSVSNPIRVEEASYIMPVDGEVLRQYSGGELIYDETMGDWRTHAGIDIACQTGDTVYVITPGEVTGVFSDGMQGNCVSVKHSDGLVSTYCGLAENGTLSVGTKLHAGDAVGTAGGSFPAESAMPCHVHLEMTQDGQHIDPMTLLKAE